MANGAVRINHLRIHIVDVRNLNASRIGQAIRVIAIDEGVKVIICPVVADLYTERADTIRVFAIDEAIGIIIGAVITDFNGRSTAP